MNAWAHLCVQMLQTWKQWRKLKNGGERVKFRAFECDLVLGEKKSLAWCVPDWNSIDNWGLHKPWAWRSVLCWHPLWLWNDIIWACQVLQNQTSISHRWQNTLVNLYSRDVNLCPQTDAIFAVCYVLISGVILAVVWLMPLGVRVLNAKFMWIWEYPRLTRSGTRPKVSGRIPTYSNRALAASIWVRPRLYQKIGKSKNGNSVFSLKDMHCGRVLTYL